MAVTHASHTYCESYCKKAPMWIWLGSDRVPLMSNSMASSVASFVKELPLQIQSERERLVPVFSG
jgi:hypothetical protein